MKTATFYARVRCGLLSALSLLQQCALVSAHVRARLATLGAHRPPSEAHESPAAGARRCCVLHVSCCVLRVGRRYLDLMTVREENVHITASKTEVEFNVCKYTDGGSAALMW